MLVDAHTYTLFFFFGGRDDNLLIINIYLTMSSSQINIQDFFFVISHFHFRKETQQSEPP